MSDSAPKSDLPSEEDLLQFTARIKTLSLPSREDDEGPEDQIGTAMLLVRDAESRKWGARWLRQSGLQPIVPTEFATVLETAIAAKPDVLLVEAGLRSATGRPIYAELQDNADFDVPVIVLCSSGKEVTPALDAGVFDIARKPFVWQAVGKRAKSAWHLRLHRRQLVERGQSIKEALDLADAARQKIRSQQTFEPITGLPNKTKFVELLRRCTRTIDRDKNALAVFVIGFTRFRLVVEAMGQEQADSILAEIGQILAKCLQDHSMADSTDISLRTSAVASLDQFRFGLMLSCSGRDDELVAFQQQLLESLSRPVQVSGQFVQLSACLGVALYPQDAVDVDSLLQRADNAMREAQSRGGGYKFYSSETDAAAARKLKLEHMLHEALDRGELTVAYQPILDVASGETIAAEALLRWRQPDGSYISPEEFVPVAEESGLMVRTGEFVLDQACLQFIKWRRANIDLPFMCVNVSKAQLISSGFVQSVRRIVEKYAIEPGDLELEISERGVLSGDFDIIQQLHELKSLGIKLSIDDFGTGDSAIAYLKELPVDTLKIDRSYVAGLENNPKDAALTSAMVALGQRMNLLVIAEGVETQGQLKVLQELGCDAYQGFLNSEAVQPDIFAAGLAQQAKSRL